MTREDSYLHIRNQERVGCMSLMKNLRELQSIITKDHSAKVAQSLSVELMACRLPLFPPILAVAVEDPISQKHLHDVVVCLPLQCNNTHQQTICMSPIHNSGSS
jgi:hypothetical protein